MKEIYKNNSQMEREIINEHLLPANNETSKERRVNRYLVWELVQNELRSRTKRLELFRDFFFGGRNNYNFGQIPADKNTSPLDSDVFYTERELEDFILLVQHVLKRLIPKVNDTPQKIAELVSKFVSSKKGGEDFNLNETQGLTYHDFSHYVIAIIRGEEDLTPPFLQASLKYRFNTREMLEDEFFAVIFERTYASNILNDSRDYNDFTKRFFKNATDTIRSTNEAEISIHLKDTDTGSSNYSRALIEEQENILADIIHNPHPKLTQMLTYIWKHRNDPRVLVNLFFEPRFGIPQFIDGLKKRKPYDFSKRSDKNAPETTPSNS